MSLNIRFSKVPRVIALLIADSLVSGFELVVEILMVVVLLADS
jgi:hypothetical protein